MSKLILVTVGTSALAKPRRVCNELSMDELLCQLKNDDGTLYSDLRDDLLESLKIKTSDYLKGEESVSSMDLTAETASLLKMEKAEKRDQNGAITFRIGKIDYGDQIVLLASETVDGMLCAEVNKGILTAYTNGRIICSDVEIRQIEGLQGEDPERFINPGLENLQCIIKSYSESPVDIYLNVTGGFKGVLPYVAPLAWDNGMTITYLFERSNGIIVIPSPPGFRFSEIFKTSWVSMP